MIKKKKIQYIWFVQIEQVKSNLYIFNGLCLPVCSSLRDPWEEKDLPASRSARTTSWQILFFACLRTVKELCLLDEWGLIYKTVHVLLVLCLNLLYSLKGYNNTSSCSTINMLPVDWKLDLDIFRVNSGAADCSYFALWGQVLHYRKWGIEGCVFRLIHHVHVHR